MAQSGFTPIQLYRSSTAAAVPLAADLVAGELAINTTDEKLYFENASGVVKLLASSAFVGTVTSVAASGGTTGLSFTGSPITSSGTFTLGGTLAVANGGTGVTTSTGTVAVVLSNSPTLVTPNLGTPSAVTLTNATGLPLTTGVTGTLPVINGGTGQTTYTNGELLIGNTTGNTLTKATLTAGTNISITNGAGAITINATDQFVGTVTSVSGTGTVNGITLTGTVTSSGSLTLGGTLSGVDLATQTSGTLAVARGGTGATDAGTARSNLSAAASGAVGSSGLTMNTARMLGRTTASAGAIEEITIGSGLSLSGGTLSSTASSGSVTSVAASGGTTGLSFTGSPITTSGTLTLSGTLAVANGGTGQTTYTNGELLIGNTTGNTLAKATLTAGTNISIANGAGTITINSTDQFVGTVTSVSGTGTVSGLTLTGTVTTSGNLTLGGTLAVVPSDFASQTANTFLAAPNGAPGAPTFRTIVAADVPTLNQNTTGTASNVTGTVAVVNGGTGQTTYTDGQLLIGNTAGNTLTKATLTAGSGVSITNGAGSITIAATGSGGTVTSVNASGGTTGLTFSGGPITTSGTLTLAGTLAVANGGTGATTLTGVVKGNGTSAFTAGTVSLTSEVSGTLPVANGGTGVTTSTGTTSVVLSNSPVLVTPTLGAASATSIANGLGSAAAPSYTFTGDTNTGMFSPGADTLAFSEGGVEAMRIDSSGNVGIGTSSPGAKLDVVSGAGTDTIIRSLAGNAAYMVLQGTSFFNFNAVLSYDSVSNLQWSVGGGGVANTLAFTTNGANERMCITSTGNVGIGTSSPGVRFDVTGQGRLGNGVAQASPSATDIASTSHTILGGQGGNALFVGQYPTTFASWIQSSFTNPTTATYNIVLQPLGGNVGIGTTAPSTRLHAQNVFNGTSVISTFENISNVSVNTAAAIDLKADQATTRLTSFRDGAGTSSSFSISPSVVGVITEAVRVTSTGNVGIGTSSPGSTLSVTGTVNFTGALTSGDLADAVGYKGVPQNAKTSAYTLALSDMGKHISITTGGVVIPANGAVAFPVGSTIVVYNNSGSAQNISITTDTLRLAGTATTGTRSLAQRGLATCVKVASTEWVVSGNVT